MTGQKEGAWLAGRGRDGGLKIKKTETGKRKKEKGVKDAVHTGEDGGQFSKKEVIPERMVTWVVSGSRKKNVTKGREQVEGERRIKGQTRENEKGAAQW